MSTALLLGHVRSGAGNGFFIPQQNALSTGRAFAGDTALARDATTAFFNPAGMPRLERAQIAAGASLIKPGVDFDNQGSTATTPGTGGSPTPYAGNTGGDPGQVGFLPTLFTALPLADRRLWAGLAVSAPFGLVLDYNDEWFGRYDSIKTELMTLDLSPAFAIDLVPRVLAIGGGLNIQYVDATLTSAIPDTLAPGGPSIETDGRARLNGSDWGVGFNVATHLTLGKTRFGIQYRSGFHHKLKGRFRVSHLQGALAGANGESDTTTDFRIPDILSLGVVHSTASDRLRLLAEVRYFNWSRFDQVRIEFDDDEQNGFVLPQSFEDSFTLGVGAEYDLLREPAGKDQWRPILTLRSGAQYDRTPTDSRLRNTSLPDGDRLWLGIGASYRVSDAVWIDGAANYAFFRAGDVDLKRTFFAGTPAEGTVNIKGRARPSFATLAVGLRWQF